MVYSTYTDVRRIIETSLADVDVTALIVLADAEIDARGLNSRPTNVVKLISMLITASLIAIREPSSRATDGVSESYMSAQDWRKQAEDQITRSGDLPLIVYTEPIDIIEWD